jgi:cysteine desulfurase
MAAVPTTGNPSSVHAEGLALRRLVDDARAKVARLLEVPADRCFFTSGATEANLLGVMGYLRAVRELVPEGVLHAVTTPIEHSSMAQALALAAEEYGVVIDTVAVDKRGIVSAADVRAAITDRTVLVSCMWANNVLGSVQPVKAVGALVAEVRASRNAAGLPIAFMTDAVQAARTLPVLPNAVGADILTISSHKLYGPKGAGLLTVRAGIPFRPLAAGGGQERGMRGGTENVTAIVGFGAAADLLRERRKEDHAHAAALRKELLAMLTERLGGKVTVLGDASDNVIPDVVFLQVQGVDAETLVVKLDVAGFAVSAGSACDSGKRQSASAVRAVYGDRVAKDGGIRIAYGRATTVDDLRRFVDALQRITGRN